MVGGLVWLVELIEMLRLVWSVESAWLLCLVLLR